MVAFEEWGIGNASQLVFTLGIPFQHMPKPTGLASQQSADPPESPYLLRPWPGLDRLGWLQAVAGLVIGLIALFSSYDHITVASRSLSLPQQWGVPCIAASVALVLVDAQLATRARDRAAESRERQVESLKRLHTAAVLSARVRLALISGEIPPDAGENGA